MFSTEFDTHITSTRRAGTATRDHRPSERARGRDGIATHLRVALYQRRLDRELADGLPVDSSPQRKLRATQMADRRSRAMLARSLRRLVADARSHPRSLSPVIAANRGAILPCETAMLTLAERIDSDTPVAATGLARTRLLLADGCGPLYNRATSRSLNAELLAIDGALDPH
jgi:hypothetical protein